MVSLPHCRVRDKPVGLGRGPERRPAPSLAGREAEPIGRPDG